jgi:predicted ester cyclase
VRAELEEAENWGDPERAAKLSTEIDFLTRETRPGGGPACPRPQGLDATIRTGTFCTYAPGPEAPGTWLTSTEAPEHGPERAPARRAGTGYRVPPALTAALPRRPTSRRRSQTEGEAVSVEENIASIRSMVDEVFLASNPDALERYEAPELLEESRLHTEQLLRAFSELVITIDDIFGQDDRVVGRFTISGNHTGAFAGAAPTSRRITWTSIRIYRFDGGKVVESWAMQDRLGLMTQLGLVESTAEPIHWASDV